MKHISVPEGTPTQAIDTLLGTYKTLLESKGLSPLTIQKRYNAIRRMLYEYSLEPIQIMRYIASGPHKNKRAAVKEFLKMIGWDAVKIEATVPKAKGHKPPPKIVKNLEYYYEVANRQPPPVALLMRMLLETGFRIGTMLNVSIDNIDMDNKEIRIKSKGRKLAVGWLTQGTYDFLMAFIKHNNDLGLLNLPIFYYYFKNDGVVRYIFRKISRVEGFRIHPHHLRAAIGTHLYRVTHNLRAVQEFYGHSDISTTAVYIAMDYAEARAAWEQAIKK